MSLRVLTYAGVLALGRPDPSNPQCDRCRTGRAQVEVDIDAEHTASGEVLGFKGARALCVPCLAAAVEDTDTDA